MKFYRCKKCGNIITYHNYSGVDVLCCNQEMELLIPGTYDLASEKHIPVVTRKGNKVKVVVGSIIHPMIDSHYIMWIIIKTNKGIHKRILNPSEKPEAIFYLLEDEKILSCYEYCNLHGLWEGK